ncbi:hypothetical protein Tco_0568921 [Tanacetum coccineum]
MNSSVDNAYVNMHECEKCLKLETGLLNKKDFIEKETYDKLFRSFTTLKKETRSNQHVFTITALKEELRKLEGKSFIACRESVNKPKVIAPVVHKEDLEQLSPKLKNNREAHVDYIRITKENADTLHDIVEQARTSNPLDNALAYDCT